MNVQRLLALSTLALSVTLPLTASAGTLTTLSVFHGYDGGEPTGPLVYQDGAIYGTGLQGGSHGSVFKLDVQTRALTVLYAFKGGSDGSLPMDLIYHAGLFYGTTYYGGQAGCGNNGCGTVFSLDATTLKEEILYKFPDPGNGNPAIPGGLIYQDGTLYGTAEFGGRFGTGSVFAINLQSGKDKTIYSFKDGADGGAPRPTLLSQGGLLYGMTEAGGADCPPGENGCGVVFAVNPKNGAETVLHAFKPGAGGYIPYSNLVFHDGLIYGSTIYGGHHRCGQGGCGTIFSVDPTTGAENVVYTFLSKHQHVAGLTARGHDLYMTNGRPTNRRNHMYEGQLSRLNFNSGKRSTFYTFENGDNGADGADPEAALVFAHGVFYGSTQLGGGAGCDGDYGCGTLFQYVP